MPAKERSNQFSSSAVIRPVQYWNYNLLLLGSSAKELSAPFLFPFPLVNFELALDSTQHSIAQLSTGLLPSTDVMHMCSSYVFVRCLGVVVISVQVIGSLLCYTVNLMLVKLHFTQTQGIGLQLTIFSNLASHTHTHSFSLDYITPKCDISKLMV